MINAPKLSTRASHPPAPGFQMAHTPSYGLLPSPTPFTDWDARRKEAQSGAHNGVARQVSIPYEMPTPKISPFSARQPPVATGHGGQPQVLHSARNLKYSAHPTASSSSKEHLIGDIPEIAWEDLTIDESLGNGEFGQVFKGTWREANGTRREVAIKALYRDVDKAQQDVNAIRDLKKEIDSFRHLKHKRLVQFLGACFQLPHLCFVTEYMPNGSLYHFLHVRKIQLPTKHARNMCMQLSEGVDYLHSRTPIVVHRDLKSLNVVLDLQFNIKLCDFGLTEYIDKNSTRTRHNGGSPRYMAPELFDKLSKITESIDIWSMACIFCEIFGGDIPYTGVKDMATLTHIVTVLKKSPDIPKIPHEETRALIKDCFEFNQDLRPSARTVAKRFQSIKKKWPRELG